MKCEFWQVTAADLQANGLGRSTAWSNGSSPCLDSIPALLPFDSNLVSHGWDIQRDKTGICENCDPFYIQSCDSVDSTNTRAGGNIDFRRAFLYLEIGLQLTIGICHETSLGSNY